MARGDEDITSVVDARGGEMVRTLVAATTAVAVAGEAVDNAVAVAVAEATLRVHETLLAFVPPGAMCA